MNSPQSIADLVPQRGTMCLLDRVLHHDAGHILCSASSHRHPHHPLAMADGRILAVVALEYAAQAAAAHGSLQLQTSPGDSVRSGFLASAREFTLSVDRLDNLEADLKIRADRLMDSGDSVVYSFSVGCGPQPVACGRLSVFFAPQIR